MPCSICLAKPGAHNFKNFGTVKGINLYYSCPSKASEIITTMAKYESFKVHLAEARAAGPWLLILDFAGMRNEHYCSYDFIKSIAREFTEENKDTLVGIWVIHQNSWLKAAIQIIKPFLKSDLLERVSILSDDKFLLLDTLKNKGITGQPLDWLARESIMSQPLRK